ncbi:MAG: hypothetical protein WAP51_04260 [Candidatus Sungiibacteriota bacterium]
MADPVPQNQPPAGSTSAGGGQKPEPKIRTMKSDVAEFMKETKPSLIQILTKQVEYQPTTVSEEKAPFPIRTILISIAGLAVIGTAGWFGYSYFTSQQPETPVTPGVTEETIPNSPIFVEKTQTATSLRNALQLQQIIFGAALNLERQQSLKRLVINIKANDGSTHLLTVKDFFDVLNIAPPRQIPDSLADTLFLYVYYGASGPRAVFAAPSRNTGRTFAGMLGWENSMQRDLDIMFLGETVNQIIAPFLDKTFKNIDYRILAVKPGTELGYFIFSAKNLLVISTSDEALQVVISRLFEAR